MKVKKIILTMVSALIMVAMAMQSVVLATTPLPDVPVYLVSLKADNYDKAGEFQYSIGDPENSESIIINRIGQTNGTGFSRIYDAYCARADKGFETRPTTVYQADESAAIDYYNAKINMVTQKSQIDTTILETMNTDVDPSSDVVTAYDAMLQLTNLLYLEEDDFDEYRASTLKTAINAATWYEYNYDQIVASMETDGVLQLLTEDQVRAVQQAALWYFSNVDQPNFNKYGEDAGWLYVKEDRTSPAYQLATASASQDAEAQALYNYLVTTSIANAKLNVEIENNVFLYTNTDASQKAYTQPVIMIEKNIKEFDLALRKFITKINGNDVNPSRVPDTSAEEDLTGNIKPGERTAKKEHRKDKIAVKKGDRVVYTIRVYNEGEVDGYAESVTDYLPAGLTFVPKAESAINTEYGWEVDATGRIVTTEHIKGELISAANRDWSKLDDVDNEGKPIYYRDLLIECEVNSQATSKNLKNIAEITKSKGKNGEKDVDSDTDNVDEPYEPTHPTTGRGEEDDDDFEDLKLNFDLALRKYITKVEREGEDVAIATRTPVIDESTIAGSTTTATYKHKKDPVLVQNGDYIYYTLTVYNEGDVNGHAKEITDQLPSYVIPQVSDADFINSDAKFELAENGYDATNNTIKFVRKAADSNPQKSYEATKLAEYSESITIKCKLNYEADDSKIFTNIAWISKYYSEDEGEVDVDLDSRTTAHPNKNKDELVTKEIGYTGKDTYTEEQLSDSNNYYKGQEDDDDFEKIKIVNGPEIHKGVKTVENQDSGYNKDEKHQWIINSDIPEDMSDYTKYFIRDDIDYRLVFDPADVDNGNIKVSIISENGAELTQLVKDVDYKLEYTPNDSPTAISELLRTKYSGTLKIIFADSNKELSETMKKAEYAGKKIKVEFNTTFAVDENGKLLAEVIGVNIPNTPLLEYANLSTPNGKKRGETPEVHTGGITLLKYANLQGEKVGLEGAEFKIYTSRTNAQNQTNEVATATSDENGLIEFVGIKYGGDASSSEDNKKPDGTYIQGTTDNRVIPGTKYYIVETKAPLNYKKNDEIREVTIDANSYKTTISEIPESNQVENKPEKFDLALRKFITKVETEAGIDRYAKADYDARVPQISGLEDFINGKTTTLKYSHSKEPMYTVKTDVVTYTLRIFNEGLEDGYASVITDDIPEGLVFLPDNEINKKYGWKMFTELPEGATAEDGKEVVELNINGSSEVKKYIETDDASKAKIIRTTYLSYENGREENLIKAFDPSKGITETNPDYKDVQVAFKVTEEYGSDRILINYAQISDDQDEDGDEVPDIDSTPDRWYEGEDDQDIEKLRVPQFDLALRKWVTQAIVTENGKTTVTETGHQPFDDPEDIVKVELHRKKLSNVTVKFRYSIRVYNDGYDKETGEALPGHIAGYAKEVKDHIPAGLKFLPEDNPDWTVLEDNVITTRKLENTLLQPGEYADVEVVLTWINGNDNLGLKVNYAEISEDHNDWGVPDKDSTPDNMKDRHEDDDDEAPVMLSVSTGAVETYMTLGLVVLITIAGGIVLIKKYVM